MNSVISSDDSIVTHSIYSMHLELIIAECLLNTRKYYNIYDFSPRILIGVQDIIV